MREKLQNHKIKWQWSWRGGSVVVFAVVIVVVVAVNLRDVSTNGSGWPLRLDI